GNTQAQLRYAESLLRGGDRGAAIYWLQQASQQHEPAAALALSELIPAQQQLWLERAASYGSRAARQQLVIDATRRNDDVNAQRWLSVAADLTQTEQALAWQWELTQASLQNLSLLLARAPEHDAVSPLVSGLTWALETPARSHCEPLVIALPEGRERLQVLRLLSEFQQHPVGRLPWCPSLTDQTDKTANVLFVRTK